MQSLFRQAFQAKALRILSAAFFIAFVLTSQAPGQSWHNADNPFDASGDGFLGVDDLHAQISELNVPTIADPDTGMLPDAADPPPFLDSNNDGSHTPLDGLLLFNEQFDNGTFSPGIPDSDIRVSGPASISFEFEDSLGNSINEASVGESFFMRATLNDSRDVPLNIYGAYVDLLFDRTLVQNSVDVDFGVDEFLSQPGELTNLGVNEVGTLLTPGFVLLEPIPTPGEQFFFTAEFTAAAPGTFEVTGDDGYVLMFGILDAISPTYGSATLTIVPEPDSTAMLLVAIPFLLAYRRRK